MRLTGKVALVTGGGAGIGKATAMLFARERASVIVVERDAVTGEAACQAIMDAGGKAIFVQTDVSQPEAVERAFARGVAEFGGLDILYNNVGGSTMRDGSVLTAPFEEFRLKIDVDLFGTWLCARAAVPEMIKRGGGAIINATSITALRGTRNRAAYSSAKGAVSALTRSMAVDFAEHNIRVNAIAPGSTLTERILERRKSSGPKPGLLDRHLLGPLDPIDVAYAVLYFAGDESRKTTGQILAIDSGFTIT